MTKERPWRDKTTLKELYWDEGLALSETAERLDTAPSTVRRWMDKHEIPRRSQSEAQRKDIPAEELQRLYHSEKLTQEEIANRYDVAVELIGRHMKRHGIETRGRSECQLSEGTTRECSSCGSPVHVPPSKQEFDNAYCDEGCFGEWQSDNLAGENNPAWKGGWDEYYGANWEEQRQKALERDGYECRACGMSQAKHHEQFGTGLNVHHVIPHREFESPEAANDLGNLVAACRSCHSRYEGLPVFPR